ncbi:MAG: hypothetical protein IAG10_20935 [Planctomycetaceae bacterium]|nr:hypothetical protein [Planctomycetaceae bacterium]
MNSSNELFEVSYTFWLMVFTFSLCVSIGYVLRFLFGKSERFVLWSRVTAFAAALTLCLLAVDGLNIAHRELGARYRLAGTVAVIATTAWLTWLHLKHSKTPWELFRRRPISWFLLASSVAMAIWSSFQFEGRLEPPSRKPFLVVSTPGKRSQVHEFVALTDRNHLIKVYRMDQVDSDSEFVNIPEDGRSLEYSGTVIQRAAAGPLANCHGWVFLDGQYLISNEAVQRILDDNGYEVVEEAMAGDVIVYRDNDRNIVHSGVVRGVLDDGTIIIESKWGTEGVFLHNPLDTPYSTLFEYYRSTRPTHRVNIVPVDELPMDE